MGIPESYAFQISTSVLVILTSSLYFVLYGHGHLSLLVKTLSGAINELLIGLLDRRIFVLHLRSWLSSKSKPLQCSIRWKLVPTIDLRYLAHRRIGTAIMKTIWGLLNYPNINLPILLFFFFVLHIATCSYFAFTVQNSLRKLYRSRSFDNSIHGRAFWWVQALFLATRYCRNNERSNDNWGIILSNWNFQ